MATLDENRPMSLLQLCVQKLAQNLIKYGPKKVRFGRLSELPRQAVEELLSILVAKNALNDNVLPHALTRHTQRLGLGGASQLRRCVLNTVGRSCPKLRALDLCGCQQVDNRIVRDVLQYCEHLQSLRLDGCTRISDSAFAPAMWKPPLAGLLSLRELSVGRCGQLTAEGLMGYVMKGAPYLRTLGLPFCRLAITDEVASELLFSFGLEAIDLSHCEKITDAPFRARSSCLLRELRVSSTQISDDAVASIASRAPRLETFDAGWVMKLTDASIMALTQACDKLRKLVVCNTQITDSSFEAIARCRHLEHLDASWCLRATSQALEILAAPAQRPPIREFVLSHMDAQNLGIDGLGQFQLGPGASPLKFVHGWVPEPPSLALPPPALSGLLGASGSSDLDEASGDDFGSPSLGPMSSSASSSAAPALKRLVCAYGPSIRQLLLDGLNDAMDAAALQDIAKNCPSLQQLALAFATGRDGDAALEAGLSAIGASCRHVTLLRIDAFQRPHKPVIASLMLPLFGELRSLTLWCSPKVGGLQDSELEAVISGRTVLETLEVFNCESLSEKLFPRWCNRVDKPDEVEVAISKQVDNALFQILGFGGDGGLSASVASPAATAGPRPVGLGEGIAVSPTSGLMPEPVAVRRSNKPLGRQRSGRQPRCQAAVALRTVKSLRLSGAKALTDRSADALAELLHDTQTVDLEGCPILSEESLRSFRKGCRYLRSVSIIARERSLVWTASTSTVKKQPRRTWATSGSSGTESN